MNNVVNEIDDIRVLFVSNNETQRGIIYNITDRLVTMDTRLTTEAGKSETKIKEVINQTEKAIYQVDAKLNRISNQLETEVRNDVGKIQISLKSAVNEIDNIRVLSVSNKEILLDMLSNITGRLEAKFKEENNEMEKALRQIDTKLYQQKLTTDSKDAEISEQLTRMFGRP